MIPINITIDGQSAVDELVSCNIQMDEMSYCWTINLDLKSKLFWNACDPNERVGTPRIKVIIGDDVYSFLCEERSTSREKEFSMSVWGRTKQALLARPYSQAAYAVSDEYGSVFTWETSAVPASEVIQIVVNEFCPYAITVNWNVEDFLVYPGNLSVENRDPISVISQLAEAIGAVLVPQIDGSLNVEYYDVLEGEIVADYDDSIEVLSASEEVPTRTGFNAVVVSGASSASSKQVWLTVEKKEETQEASSCFDSFETDTTIYTYVSFNVRVYFYNSDPSAVLSKFFPYGSVIEGVTGIESITETVQLVFGSGNTSKTNTAGETEVVGDPDVPLEYREVTYNVNYKDYSITATEEGDIGIIFYYSAENYTVYSFTATDACTWEDICDGVVLLPSCNYPNEEKYTDSSERVLGQFHDVYYQKPHRREEQVLVWSGSYETEGVFERKVYKLSWSSLETSNARVYNALTQLGLSGKYKNLRCASCGRITGVYLERPVNASSVPSERLVYAPTFERGEPTESFSYHYWFSGRRNHNNGGFQNYTETVYYIRKSVRLVTNYESRDSALLELLLSGQFFDLEVSGSWIYGKRKGRPKNITSPLEKIVFVYPKTVYYQYTKTETLYAHNPALAEFREKHAGWESQGLEQVPVDFQYYDSYKDYSEVTRVMLNLQNSGKWCDLEYNGNYIYGRRISPLVDGDYSITRELIGAVDIPAVVTIVSKTVLGEVPDENGSQTTETVDYTFTHNDYSELTNLLLNIATSDVWVKATVSLPWVYGYRRKRAVTENADYAPGDEVEIKVYYDGTSISEKWCSYGALSFVRSGVDQFEEEIEFLNGEASTEYPISSLVSINYHHSDENLFSDPAYTKGGRKVICAYLKGKLSYRLVGAAISYQSNYSVFKVAIPSDWQGDSFSIGFCFDGCEDPKMVDVSVGYKKGTDLTGLRLLHNNNFVGNSEINTINFVDGD